MRASRKPFYRLFAATGAAVLLVAIAFVLLSSGSAPTRAQGPGVEVIPFVPQVQLVKDAPRPPLQDAEGPPTDGPAALAKPPDAGPAGPQEAYVPLNPTALVGPQEWFVELYEGFEGVFPGDWILEDFSDDGFERSWGDNTFIAQAGSWSAWPAAYGADALDPNIYYYPQNLDSWMEYGPFDFSNAADILVTFGLWYKIQPDADLMHFCASTDFVNYFCANWTGDSGGWTDQVWSLDGFAGEPQVWLAWVFESDDNYYGPGYDGPFVDEVWVFADRIPPVQGQLIQNGSFEEAGGSLPPWQTDSSDSPGAAGAQSIPYPSLRPDIARDTGLGTASISPLEAGVTADRAFDGIYSAYLARAGGYGVDLLYQQVNVPAAISDIVLDFAFLVQSAEPNLDTDIFCIGMWNADFSALLVDPGCLDAADVSGMWQRVTYTLNPTEVANIAGQSIWLTLELYNSGAAGSGTSVWIDAVQFQALGSGEYLDDNEPNDGPSEATPISCGDAITGVVGDALGGFDVDWFEIPNVPAGQIDLDITAAAAHPPSDLDSVVGLWDSAPTLLAWNDDDGTSYDSYVTYTIQSVGTYYASVESYSGNGSASSFYTLTIRCAGSGSGPPEPEIEPPPQANTWTIMLYLNAEDPNFESILTGYRRDIEAFIGTKSAFLKVVILYDGPESGDTVRYLVQPNGAYTLGANMWTVGELNMGNPGTLTDFVSWAMDTYPAENYYLAIDDHGDGVYGISFDATSGSDQLTPPELYSALKNATHNGARKIDIFDYEACLMGLAENAYDLRQWVDYIVFSEQISWGINTYPRYFYDLAASNTPRAVGQRIIDRYHNEAMTANSGRGFPHTISLIDTSQMAAVNTAASNLGNALQSKNRDTVNDRRDDAQAFAADYDATSSLRAEYIDLWDLAEQVSGMVPSQAAAVQSAVEAAVVHQQVASGRVSGYEWDHSGAHGLAIYYPPATSSPAYESYVELKNLYEMNDDGTWDEFLEWVLPTGTRRGLTAFRVQARGGRDADAYAYKDLYIPMVTKQK